MISSKAIVIWMIIFVNMGWSQLAVEGIGIQFEFRKPLVKWTQPTTNWEIRSIPRSITPHVELKYYQNRPNADASESGEEAFLKRLEELKNETSSANMTSLGEKLSNVPSYLPFLQKLLKLLGVKDLQNEILSKATCAACKAGAGLLLHTVHAGASDEGIIKLIHQYCIKLNIESSRVCEGVSRLFGTEVVYVLRRTTMKPSEICSFVIGDGCGDSDIPNHEWEVLLPPIPKPPVFELPVPKEGAPYFKVLHISDTHYDPHYAEGSNADCKEPLCCRWTNGEPSSPAAAAGKWGDYRKCDTPKRTVDNMLAHIADTHGDIDYILWTGDLPPHDVWNQTKEENSEVLKETVKQMREMFPGVPIFPALGNHEAAPVNSFPQPYINQDGHSISWLYNELDVQWRKWLPYSASHTVRRGAFYSVLVRPGFRIISLNMNYCNNKNWWLLLNSADPANELQWFIYELQNAESSNEKVHVIGHIPPGHSDCLKVWSRNFYKIVSRYENTILAQFYGHTHFDEFEMFYDPQDLSHPNSVAYIGPSVSPYYDLNPGYRIYYVDGEHDATTYQVIDHESWIMDLKNANLYDYPFWYKLYTARAAYNMTSLRPVDWDNLLNEMAGNQELFDLYYKNYWKNSPLKPTCDSDCRKRILCDARSGRSHDRSSFCSVDGDNGISWASWFFWVARIFLNLI